MAQPVSQSSTHVAVSSQSDAESDLLDASTVSVLSVGLLLFSVIAALVVQPWRKVATAPSSVRKPKQSAPPASKRAGPRAPIQVGAASTSSNGAPRSRRRVIRLHAVTPGQTPYEYNVGDGRTGSALSRAA
jgi:hypothetical protein